MEKIFLKRQLQSLFKSMDFISKKFLVGGGSRLSSKDLEIYSKIYQQLGLAWEYLGLQCQHEDGYKKIKSGQPACKICGKIQGGIDPYYLLPRTGHKAIGKKVSPNSKKIFSNKEQAVLLEDNMDFHGAKINVDVHNMYKSRLFKDKINIADERSVSLIERGIKCCIDQRVVRVDLKSRVGKVKSLPCTGFVWELNRETLRRFPVLFDFDRYGRLLGIMILS